MIVFYVRCSTAEQNEARQLEDANHCKAEKIFIDKLSGKSKDRPELKAMLAFVRAGDKVICSDISRIARNTRDLLSILDELQRKGVAFRAVCARWRAGELTATQAQQRLHVTASTFYRRVKKLGA